ncbi:MAG: AAA family ATPase [Chloroflexi bacterium]|nr:MAG: AAA family ATPase [Chloroflexota bacterium]
MTMSALQRVEELNILTRAKYPIIYIISWEERRIEDMLRQVALDRRKKLYGWTLTHGIAPLDLLNADPVDPATRDPLAALDFVARSQEAAIFVLKDFHPYLDESRGGPDQPVIIRRLRDITNQLKESRKTLIILSPVLQIPPDIEKDITVLDYSLPTLEELELSLERVVRSAREIAGVKLKMTAEERERVLNAARGLTCIEAENVFAKSLVMRRKLDLDVIIAEKEQIIRRSQILEYYESVEGFAHIGGLGLVKQWLRKRGIAFSEKARRFGLPEPKGLLLLGVQGAGKSLLAKAVASQWQLPLLRLDLGRVFSELVGSSEQNIRTALRLAESVAPCVLWLDEIEKGLAGASGSGSSDAGTSARVFGSLLTWMQEKTSPVFVIGTANDISALPPEILRKGRFDEIFFVDLPQPQERREIFAIHLARRGRDPLEYDLNQLALASEGFSGAEIEQVVIDALYDAFEDNREVTNEDLLRNIRQTIPLSQTMGQKISALRQWAKTHARPASEPPQPQPLRPFQEAGNGGPWFRVADRDLQVIDPA